MNYQELKNQINIMYLDHNFIDSKFNCRIINKTIELLDKGYIKVINKTKLNIWVKKAILLYFKIRKISNITLDKLVFYDKIPLKTDFGNNNIRKVPISIVRYGSYIGKNVVLMPSYINIGAYVDDNSMIDTWATVGSCAQIGKNVHISGGVSIGGVLEPIGTNPVVIEDNCFIGSRSVIVEGTHICNGAVLGANVIITSSTKIIDVSGNTPLEFKNYIPSNSIVIPGTYPKKFFSGTYNIPCALIIGKKDESTRSKTLLNEILRK